MINYIARKLNGIYKKHLEKDIESAPVKNDDFINVDYDVFLRESLDDAINYRKHMFDYVARDIEILHRTIDENNKIIFDFFNDGNENKRIENKKRIYSPIDPYGEENWEEE